jgi:hypothetical protein
MAQIVTDTGALDGITKGMKALGDAVSENKDKIVAFVLIAKNALQAYFGVVIDNVKNAYNATKPLWDFLISQIGALYRQVKDNLLPAFMEFWDPVGKALTTFIFGVLGVALIGLVEVLRLLVAGVTMLLRWVDKMVENLKGPAIGAINAVKDAWTSFTGVLDKVVSALKSVYEWAQKAYSAAKSAIGLGDKKSSSKKVDDAVISPSGNVVTTNPRDWLIATQNPYSLAGIGNSAGITINIGTVNGSDRTAAEKFASEIALAIKRQVRI